MDFEEEDSALYFLIFVVIVVILLMALVNWKLMFFNIRNWLHGVIWK